MVYYNTMLLATLFYSNRSLFLLLLVILLLCILLVAKNAGFILSLSLGLVAHIHLLETRMRLHCPLIGVHGATRLAAA